MSVLERAKQLALLIAEPRVKRVILFAIYVALIYGGHLVLTGPSRAIESVLGETLLTVFGSMLALGGLLGAIAVLPDVWWLERAGLWLIGFGLLIYVIVIISIGGSVLGPTIAIVLMLFLAIRWLEIQPKLAASTG